MKNDELDMNHLDALFAQERDALPVVSDAFLARVLTDAQNAHEKPARPQPRLQWYQKLLAAGEWPSMAALTACAVFGLYIGYSSSAGMVLGIESEIAQDEGYEMDNSFGETTLFDVAFLENAS
ncbi:hypothetical protein GCM10007939_09330 [Amylibacter marinus]|uniref:Dihydroorotate dehydrogenase n=1 Tax=Amylibacter marinus TaxID=1475483 RepID=A0ABQ5VTI1_9RHOB|nr:hypothetical protein [Amylibacter marinus]GLQ34650.1 hypothetical protein GCM10007939_09330 [Amylibacter marinus]